LISFSRYCIETEEIGKHTQFGAPVPPIEAPEPKIGGESPSKIYLQLVCSYKGKGALPSDEFFLERAESIFKWKRQILLRMDELDEGRGWVVNGGRFLKNRNGMDFSEDRLKEVFYSLQQNGRESPFFSQFRLSKRNGGF